MQSSTGDENVQEMPVLLLEHLKGKIWFCIKDRAFGLLEMDRLLPDWQIFNNSIILTEFVSWMYVGMNYEDVNQGSEAVIADIIKQYSPSNRQHFIVKL